MVMVYANAVRGVRTLVESPAFFVFSDWILLKFNYLSSVPLPILCSNIYQLHIYLQLHCWLACLLVFLMSQLMLMNCVVGEIEKHCRMETTHENMTLLTSRHPSIEILTDCYWHLLSQIFLDGQMVDSLTSLTSCHPSIEILTDY